MPQPMPQGAGLLVELPREPNSVLVVEIELCVAERIEQRGHYWVVRLANLVEYSGMLRDIDLSPGSSPAQRTEAAMTRAGRSRRPTSLARIAGMRFGMVIRRWPVANLRGTDQAWGAQLRLRGAIDMTELHEILTAVELAEEMAVEGADVGEDEPEPVPDPTDEDVSGIALADSAEIEEMGLTDGF